MQISEKDALQFISMLTAENDKLKSKVLEYENSGMYDYYKTELKYANEKITEYEDTIKNLRRELSAVYDKLAKLEDELEDLKSNGS